MTKALIVCVDDDDAMLATVARCLRREPTFDVRSTINPHDALAWRTLRRQSDLA